MGSYANDEGLQLRQLALEDLACLTIPGTPETTPEDTTMDSVSESINGRVSLEGKTSPGSKELLSGHRKLADGEGDVNPDENPYASLNPDTTLAIPVTNPFAFPIKRLREVQEGRQPSTQITNILVYKTVSGPVTQVTAHIQDGSINHLIIRDSRVIEALGFAWPHFDTINLDTARLRLDETFTIRVFARQKVQNLDNWIMGELISGRHAYLYWLDERGTVDPKAAPFAAEARAIARKTGRRWPNVMRKIDGVWKLEQGNDRRQ